MSCLTKKSSKTAHYFFVNSSLAITTKLEKNADIRLLLEEKLSAYAD